MKKKVILRKRLNYKLKPDKEINCIYIMIFNCFVYLLLISVGVSADFLQRFEDWKNRFEYMHDGQDMYQVLKKWYHNDKHIESVNSMNETYVLGHNQFSGMDRDDFRKYLIEQYLDRKIGGIYENLPISYKDSINWVDQGAVTPVKDQGQCGSCWSFSTTGALEGAYYIKNDELLSFSEQQLVDCDNLRNGGRDHGCNGGLMDNAFNWIGKNNGLCTENDYPYVSGSTTQPGECEKTCSVVSESDVNKAYDVKPSSDEEMMTALSQQPVSIAIQADQRDFQLYKSGVFTGKCGTELDHGVLVVGYDSEDSEDYYLVKNSWGETWGESGFIKLGRGKQYNNGDGQCGMLLQGSYPVLE